MPRTTKSLPKDQFNKLMSQIMGDLILPKAESERAC